jgi:hypothetical protein
MHIPKLAILCGVWLIGAVAWSTCGQQAPAQVPSLATQKAAVSSPSTFQLAQEDVNLALGVSRALAAGNHEQVQKMLTSGQMSIPQFERVVASICDLSAERRLATAGGAPSAPAGSLTAVTISNQQDLQTELAARINEEFGGRGQNYKNASALVSRQLSVADEVCASPTLRAQGAR